MGNITLYGNDIYYKCYDAKVEESKAVLTLNDTKDDFPVNATIQITRELTDGGLVQFFNTISDKPTVFNMINYSYFNLYKATILH